MPPRGRRRRARRGSAGQQGDQRVAAGLQVRDQRAAVISSPCASAASPARCTNTGAHEVLNSISLPDAVHQGRRQHQPAQPPAGHQEALGEAVRRPRADRRASAMSRKLGAQRSACARSTAARRPRRRGSRCRSGGNGRGCACCSSRVSVQPVGLFGALTIRSPVRRRDCGAAAPRVEPPRRRPRTSGHAAHARAEDRRLRRQVGPHRRDRDHLVARAQPAPASPASRR